MSEHDEKDPTETNRGPGSFATDTTVSLKGDGMVGAPHKIAALEQLLPRGTNVGRYVILDLVGHGGMGAVYAAYDPELDRRVAIKVLHPLSNRSDGGARLRREAQAMARLSHPNVVSIFDVVVVGKHLVLAMELVSGTTLATWLKAQRRTPQAILDALIQAGRGLQAAHEAGLVHRDFKPTNVLVDDAGRVLVTDFGVVRASGETTPDPVRGDATTPLALDTTLTHAGAAVGTPRYMAPEQRRGRSDANSDQFAFCVTLFEALYGEHPYGVTNPVGPASLPDDRRISARAGRALLRGLSLAPEDRFPSMRALLSEMEDRSGGRVFRVVAGAAGVLLVAGVVAMMARGSTTPPRPCADAGELTGVWDDDVKQRARAAFQASGLPYAAAAWQTTERKLDGYAVAWSAMRREACEATQVRGTQSGELLDARMVCLDRRREELHALSRLFVGADATVVEKSIDAAHGLDDLTACTDVVALSARTPLPTDPKIRASLGEVTTLLARAKAETAAGRLDQATALATQAVERARDLGHPPTSAAALVELARGQDSKEAEETLHRALQAAELGRDDLVKVDAWIQLIYVVGYRLGRPREGERWATYADLVLRRLDEHPDLKGELLRYQGMMAALNGRPTDANQYYREALALAEKVGGPTGLEAGRIHAYWAVAYGQSGNLEEALQHDRRAVAIFEHVRGPDHPELAMPLNNLATSLFDDGDFVGARQTYERARAIWVASPGRAREGLHLALHGLARISLEEGRNEESLRYQELALDTLVTQLGPNHPEGWQIISGMAEALLLLDRPREARDRAMRAIAVTEGAFGPKHPDLVSSLTVTATAELRLGNLSAANALLDRASAILAENDLPQLVRADLAFARARAARAAGDQTRARELANEARGYTADTGKLGARLLATIDRWLAEVRAP